MHFLRSHFTLVTSSAFLAGFAALGALAAFRVIGLWEAAELSACGALLAACVHLALILWRAEVQAHRTRERVEEQSREVTEVARESREELSERMDALLERMTRADAHLSALRGTGAADGRPVRRDRVGPSEPAVGGTKADAPRVPERAAAAESTRVAS